MSDSQYPPSGSEGVPPQKINMRKPAPPPPVSLQKSTWASTQAASSAPPTGPSPSPSPTPPAKPTSSMPSYPQTNPGEPAPAGPVEPGGNRANPALLAVAGIAAIAIVAFVGFLAFDEESDQEISSTTVRSTPAIVDSDSPSTPTAPPEPAPLTFDNMRDLTYLHYSDLPSNPRATWSRLDPHFTAKTDWNDYVDFWSSIASVTVDSVSPRSADSVNIRLTYVPRAGRPNTEDRWLSFTSGREGLRIYDSGRMNTVG